MPVRPAPPAKPPASPRGGAQRDPPPPRAASAARAEVKVSPAVTPHAGPRALASPAAVARDEPETLLEDSIVDTHQRMRGASPEDEPEPTSEIIPLMSVPPPGRDADKYIGCTIDGRYVVQSVLGEGGMGVVYKCRRRVFEKIVAVKILRSDLAKNHEVTERFVTEAKAASAIGNAHIVDVFDFGELPDGSTYFAMEYLDGPSIADLVESGELVGSPRVLSLARQIAEGLDAAHAARIVHRDLKPDNIFVVDREGAEFVKIVDFGIAKVAGLQNKITRAGAIFGTPHYMSPEQCKGTAVDHRTDIYSLGVMMYEMIVGTVPFDAENPLTILSQHIHDRPVPPSRRVDGLPPDLEAIVLRCLEKDPADRFQSMHEVAAALAAVERGESIELDVPISIAPPPPPEEEPLPLVSQRSPAVEPASGPSSGGGPPASRGPSSLPASVPSSRLDLALEAAVRDADVEAEWAKAHRKSRWPWLFAVALLAGGGAAALGIFGTGNPGTMSEAFQAARPAFAEDYLGSRWLKQAEPKKSAVALVLSPIDAHAFRDGKDLGTMPLTVEVEQGKTTVIEVKRAGYWTRKIELDGMKPKLLVRLSPVPGSRLLAPGKERTAKELGFDETGGDVEEAVDAPAEAAPTKPVKAPPKAAGGPKAPLEKPVTEAPPPEPTSKAPQPEP